MKKLLLLVAVVLVANAFALAVAASNARGEPEATITLTEREARLVGTASDNTGMTLVLSWDRLTPTEWFDRAKLTTIGFDCSVDPAAPDAEKHYQLATLARSAYVVLEYDPTRLPSSPASSEMRDESGPRAGRPVEYESRLRPVDVGTDPARLRATYRDRGRYIVTAAIVEARRQRSSVREPFRLRGRLTVLLPGELWVPREMQATIAAAVGKNDRVPYSPLTGPPRYEVTIAYGRSLLPRVIGVKKAVP